MIDSDKALRYASLMQLEEVEISGYRSISGTAKIRFEPNVTILLGPNDHGKSNVLHAISHLNGDNPFTLDRDLNWDHQDSTCFPRIVYSLRLTPGEREELQALERRSLSEAKTEQKVDSEAGTEGSAAEPSEDAKISITVEVPEEISVPEIPEILKFERKGVEGPLVFTSRGELSEPTLLAVLEMLPRVEIIPPNEKITDEATAAEFEANENEFMRGIFYHAGLNPKDTTIFEQTNRTVHTLRNASDILDSKMRQTWSQGSQLGFYLQHDSKNSSIQLYVSDPAVTTTHVRASRRSSGFTNYFAIKTILHARKTENKAQSYIWIFDEPGIYLHPAGQFDLLQVIETLGKSNQVVYSTHSLFLINRTFPTRHRLIRKTDDGTVVETKPFTGRWGSVISCLGLSLTGTVLFANHVLLTEGDSDPIYLQCIFQKLIDLGVIDANINSFTVMGTGESKNAAVLIRLLLETAPRPKIAVLFDGDDGGKQRREDIQSLLTAKKIPFIDLKKGMEIEDYLPKPESLFVEAVSEFAKKLAADRNIEIPNPENLEKNAGESFKGKSQTTGASDWAADFIKSAAQLKNKPSKVGIAREWIAQLEEDANFSKNDVPKALMKLISEIAEKLELPKQSEAETGIFKKHADPD